MRDRHLLPHGAVLVAQVRATVRGAGPEAAFRGHAVEPIAGSPGRGLCEDRRREAFPLAGRRSRGRRARKLRDEGAEQESRIEIPEESDEAARPR